MKGHTREDWHKLKDCTHCNIMDHTKDICFMFIAYPSDWKEQKRVVLHKLQMAHKQKGSHKYKGNKEMELNHTIIILNLDKVQVEELDLLLNSQQNNIIKSYKC